MADLAWLALLDAAEPGTVAVTDPRDGTAAGHLLVTVGRAKPHRTAVRVAPTLVGDGPAISATPAHRGRGEGFRRPRCRVGMIAGVRTVA